MDLKSTEFDNLFVYASAMVKNFTKMEEVQKMLDNDIELIERNFKMQNDGFFDKEKFKTLAWVCFRFDKPHFI